MNANSTKDGHPRILVGVCTYNEAGNLREMLARIAAALPNADVIVVDDASPDGTATIANEFEHPVASSSVRCLVREQRGLGGAIRAAMQTSVEGDYDLFCNLDADLSHDPADLPRLVAAVIEEDADVAVGSRYIPGGKIVGWPKQRMIMSRLINSIARRRLGLPVHDASGSFRCYRVESLAACDLNGSWSDGYSFLQQVLLKLHRNGARMVEVPIIFTERMIGDSKLNFREAIRSGWTVFNLN